jgi:D-inositol-3-phosphate glycosyltransferase
MNVYVRELVSALAHAGVDCTTYTRTWRDDLPAEVMIEPNHKVVHIPAGAVDMPKGDMISIVRHPCQLLAQWPEWPLTEA